MSEPTIVTILRADHQAGLHSEPHPPNQYCAECAQASKSPEFDQGAGWRVLDPDGNVVASGGVSIAQMDGKLAEQVEQARTEGEQE